MFLAHLVYFKHLSPFCEQINLQIKNERKKLNIGDGSGIRNRIPWYTLVYRPNPVARLNSTMKK